MVKRDYNTFSSNITHIPFLRHMSDEKKSFSSNDDSDIHEEVCTALSAIDIYLCDKHKNLFCFRDRLFHCTIPMIARNFPFRNTHTRFMSISKILDSAFVVHGGYRKHKWVYSDPLERVRDYPSFGDALNLLCDIPERLLLYQQFREFRQFVDNECLVSIPIAGSILSSSSTVLLVKVVAAPSHKRFFDANVKFLCKELDFHATARDQSLVWKTDAKLQLDPLDFYDERNGWLTVCPKEVFSTVARFWWNQCNASKNVLSMMISSMKSMIHKRIMSKCHEKNKGKMMAVHFVLTPTMQVFLFKRLSAIRPIQQSQKKHKQYKREIEAWMPKEMCLFLGVINMRRVDKYNQIFQIREKMSLVMSKNKISIYFCVSWWDSVTKKFFPL